MTGLPYACPELLIAARLPLTIGVDSFQDVRLSNIPNYPDGVYRFISRTFLRWLKLRLDIARKPDSAISPESLAQAEMFYADCVHESGGLEPSEKSLPSGYGRPTRESAWEFNGSFDLWESTNPKGVTDMNEFTDAGTSHAALNATMVKIPHLFPLVRGPSLPPRYVRNDQIPAEATEFHQMAGNWWPIRDEWKLLAGTESKGAIGMWSADREGKETSGFASTLEPAILGDVDEIDESNENPLDNLI